VQHKDIKSKIRTEKLQHRLDQDEKVLKKINQDLEKLLLSMPEIIEHKNIMSRFYLLKKLINSPFKGINVGRKKPKKPKNKLHLTKSKEVKSQ